MYRRLSPARIIETTRTLLARIGERFPESGLLRVAEEVLAVGQESTRCMSWLARPLWYVRVLVLVAAVLMLLVAAGAFLPLDRRAALSTSVADFLQGMDAAVNQLVLMGVALFFLLTWETRLKRRRALEAMRVLRSLAHIVDMHQLTKDPEHILRRGRPTKAGRIHSMTRFELARYLTYCSELLAIISKLAALTVQEFNEPVTLDAVDDMQDLCNGLGQKIWQKIMILDAIEPRRPEYEPRQDAPPTREDGDGELAPVNAGVRGPLFAIEPRRAKTSGAISAFLPRPSDPRFRGPSRSPAPDRAPRPPRERLGPGRASDSAR